MNAITPPLSSDVRMFTQLLSATRRGARLARLLAAERLTAWEVPPGTGERAEQVVAELATNAVLHGQVSGRDFQLALTCDPGTGALRVAVTDAAGGRPPLPSAAAGQDGESGRGLLLVAALADRWGTRPCPPSGKTVWADIDPAPPPHHAAGTGPGASHAVE